MSTSSTRHGADGDLSSAGGEGSADGDRHGAQSLRRHRPHASAAARLRQHVRDPGARRRRPRARAAHHRRCDAGDAGVAGRIRLRVSGTAGWLCRPGEDLRADVPQSAAGDGFDAQLSRACVRAGRSHRRRCDGGTDQRPRSRFSSKTTAATSRPTTRFPSPAPRHCCAIRRCGRHSNDWRDASRPTTCER